MEGITLGPGSILIITVGALYLIARIVDIYRIGNGK